MGSRITFKYKRAGGKKGERVYPSSNAVRMQFAAS